MSSEIAGKLGNLGINGQIDMGVRLGARYYIIFLLISMPIDIPLALAEVAGDKSSSSALSFILGIPLIALINPIAKAAIIVAILDITRDAKPTFRRAYSSVFLRFGAVIAASLLWLVSVAGGVAALVIPGLFLLIAGQCIMGVVVTEKLDGVAAFRRSWELVKPKFWSVLLIFLFVEITPGLLNTPISLLLSNFLGDGNGVWVAAIIQRTWSSPFAYAILAVMFLDLQARNKKSGQRA
jgi:hypothetical protein